MIRRGLLLGSVVAVAAVVGVAVLAHGQGPESLRPIITADYPDVAWVEPATLARWLRRPAANRPVLLDARTEAEYDVSHLADARRVDPDATAFDSLDVPHDSVVVVYCSVGYRSAAIAQRMQRAGYRHVYNLTGGIFLWANQGRPVYRDGRTVTVVHPYDATWGRYLDAAHHPPSQ